MTTWLIAAGGAAFALLFTFIQGRLSEARREQARRADEERLSRDLAYQVQNDVGALPPDAAREELSKWAR